MTDPELILKKSEQIKPLLVEWRRHFHRHPETGLNVPETAAFIRSLLKEWGIELQDGLPANSIAAVIRGRPEGGPPLGLRADMDALEISEQTGAEYQSGNRGIMHACGHDGHMAMLLGACYLLSREEASLPQDTWFIFQPGEEDPGGAELIMETGLLDHLKGILAIHLDPSLPVGAAGINHGRAMASTDCFHITLTGRGGHAALPHQSVDPIAIAAQVINSLQFIVSRLIDPVQPAVLTLGSIQGGYRPNVIPDEVKLSGTIRAFSEEIRRQIREEIVKTLDMHCKRYGADFTLDLVPGYPPVINDPDMSAFMHQTANLLSKRIRMESMPDPRMAGEDFSYYLKRIPGAFYWLGCGNRSKGITRPLHHSCFDLDEDVLPLGTALHCAAALSFTHFRNG